MSVQSGLSEQIIGIWIKRYLNDIWKIQNISSPMHFPRTNCSLSKVVKAWSQHPRRKMLQGARTEAMRLPEPQQVIESPVSQSPCLEGEPQVAGRTATLRCRLHQKNPLRHPKEQVIPHVPQE